MQNCAVGFFNHLLLTVILYSISLVVGSGSQGGGRASIHTPIIAGGHSQSDMVKVFDFLLWFPDDYRLLPSLNLVLFLFVVLIHLLVVCFLTANRIEMSGAICSTNDRWWRTDSTRIQCRVFVRFFGIPTSHYPVWVGDLFCFY